MRISIPRSRTARTALHCAAARGANEYPKQDANASLVAPFAPLGRGSAVLRCGLGGFLARYPVGLGRPRAEVDRLAALRAERAPARRRRPFDRLPAVRTGDDLRRHHRLQNASSKSTSRAYAAPRSIPETPMKRMFSAYLFALISGTH